MSWYLALIRSNRLLESTMAAPPTRNKQLGIIMDFSLPKYQFCVMFSVDTTSAVELGCKCSSCCASPIEITPAEHPMPARLYVMMFVRILNRLTIIADSEGVGLNSEQLTTRMSTFCGLVLVFRSASSTQLNNTSRASSLAASIDVSTGSCMRPSGT